MPISIRVSVNMFAFSQVIVLVAFLATIVFGLPLNGGGLENIWPSEASRMPSRDIDRIFGGQEAAIGQFPYHISLQSRVFGNLYQVRCGISIISNRFILTAGHCKPYGDDLSGLRVVVGAHWLNGTDFTAYNKLVGVVSWGCGCGLGFPNGFTRISAYLDWINKNMAESV